MSFIISLNHYVCMYKYFGICLFIKVTITTNILRCEQTEKNDAILF